jgi:hypothetical protein
MEDAMLEKSHKAKNSPFRPDPKGPLYKLNQSVRILSGVHRDTSGDITLVEWDEQSLDWVYHVRSKAGYLGNYTAQEIEALPGN